jgi:hypothetical protein
MLNLLFIEVLSVTTEGINLRWRNPVEIADKIRVDWKLDDNDDSYWPTDFFNGGTLDFPDDVNTHTFIPIKGRSYAFRTRNSETQETSNIVHATALN